MRQGEKLFTELTLDEVYLNEYISFTNKKQKIKRALRILAVCLVIIMLPNMSPVFAKTLYDLPIVGKFFQVITIRDYHDKSMDVEVPFVEGADINKSTEDYIESIIEAFKENAGEDFGHLNISYEVLEDSETWFTLRVDAFEVQASGYARSKYYNIDKQTGKHIAFGDYIGDFENKKETINAFIVDFMEADMKENDTVYFLDESGFTSVRVDENYYINEDGDLVISFDEYEVAPGFMGIVEIVIPKEIYE